MKLEPPKLLDRGLQAAVQLQYSYFLDSKSGNCFSNPVQLRLYFPGKVAVDHWSLTLTYSHASEGAARNESRQT